jgi:hypothetical protein
MATSLKALVPLCALLAFGCTTGSSNTMLGAATMTTLAAGAAVANRASGGCVAVCTNGTACNPKTGLCERQPCRGECGVGERCEENFIGHKCVPGAAPGDVSTASKASADTKLPTSSVPVDTSSSSGPPVVVPKAEQQDPPKK